MAEAYATALNEQINIINNKYIDYLSSNKNQILYVLKFDFRCKSFRS